MEKRKYPGLGQTQQSMQRTTSAGIIGSSNVHPMKEKSRQSDSGADALPPKHPTTSNFASTNASATGGKTATSYLRLGGLSRYLLEKAQSNDSGLDLSPATLQTLVHPLRTSNSSSSSLSGRSLFESSASSSAEESPQVPSASRPNLESTTLPPSTPIVSRSVLSEQSHNASETTIIEKTLTDEQSSKVIINISKNDPLEPINERENKTSSIKTKKESVPSKPYQQDSKSVHLYSNPDNVTPKDGRFQVPYSYNQNRSKQRLSKENENTDPGAPVDARTYGIIIGNQFPQQNNSFASPAEVAATIPSRPTGSTGELTRKCAMQTPKPKSCKKKPTVPSSVKKPSGSGWKFLSEHVQNKEFLILEQLGKGGCGEVKLVMEKDTRKQYALKIVQLHGIEEALVQECINEVEMLIDLKGTDLVVDIHNWEFNRTERTMKILMEKGQCDLNHTIFRANRTKNPIKLLKIRYIWESLLSIVQEIHSRGIVHADLKPANFVWFDDNLKIIDFGIASRLQSDLTSIAMPNPKGTLNFISPEIIKLDDSGRSKLSPKSDIWALGCILYLMVYGCTPFEHISHPVTKMNAIVQGDIMYPALPSHLRESNVLSVLKLCFQTDYKQRPSATELLKHSFINS